MTPMQKLKHAPEELFMIITALVLVLLLALTAAWAITNLAQDLTAALGGENGAETPPPAFNIAGAERVLSARGLLQ